MADAVTEEFKQIIVGLILGDLNVQKQTKNSNVRLCFKQGLVHKDYLMHLYDLFKTYCPTPPKTTNPVADKRTGKTYIGIWFNTYSLPCFNTFYDMFYLAGKKVMPSNIAELLTPLSLAYWICDASAIRSWPPTGDMTGGRRPRSSGSAQLRSC